MMSIPYADNLKASKFAVQSYAALVLARQQKAPLGALREIWERHAQAASGLPLMQLGMALKLMGDAPRSQQALDLLRRMILGQPVPDARLYSPEEVEQSRQTPFES